MQTKSVRGSIIAFSLILLSILLTAGLSVVSVAALEKRSGLATEKSVVAFQAADSGTERILKRIYIDNSPPLTSVPLNGTMTDGTLTQLASHLDEVTPASACSSSTNKITATSSNAPGYTFEVVFLDGSDAQIACNDTQWRDKLVKIKTEGFFRQTARVLELGIKPRPKCLSTNTLSYGGETYGMLQIGDQCWMNRNLNIGIMINGSVLQTNNGTVEKYCYGNVASNCTSNHPNRPDGGLYTWDEAMGYTRNEAAQGICPNGWHIPTRMDWYILYHELDPTVNNPTALTCQGTDIGFKLPPGGSSGFEKNFAGVWAVGSFSGRNSDPTFMAASHWSSTENPSRPATEAISENHLRVAGNNSQFICRQEFSKIEAYSVRCVFDY